MNKGKMKISSTAFIMQNNNEQAAAKLRNRRLAPVRWAVVGMLINGAKCDIVFDLNASDTHKNHNW